MKGAQGVNYTEPAERTGVDPSLAHCPHLQIISAVDLRQHRVCPSHWAAIRTGPAYILHVAPQLGHANRHDRRVYDARAAQATWPYHGSSAFRARLDVHSRRPRPILLPSLALESVLREAAQDVLEVTCTQGSPMSSVTVNGNGHQTLSAGALSLALRRVGTELDWMQRRERELRRVV